MKDVNSIAKRAMEYKEKGLSEKEIGDELHLSPETVTWLLTRGIKGGEAPKDVKIGWRSVGVYGNRIGFMAAAMSDIALEELEKRQMDADSIVGDTIKAAIADVHESGGTAVLAVVLVNKTAHDELAGVPLRALIRARSI